VDKACATALAVASTLASSAWGKEEESVVRYIYFLDAGPTINC
jgi:hypothetical protein